MTYDTEIIVALPLEDFFKKLDDPANMKHWQKGLQSYELIYGSPGAIGSKTKLSYKIGKREMVLIETITAKNAPHEFHATYDTKGMHNIQENYFEETADGHTKWVSKNEFIPTKLFYRLMTLLLPGAFKKQSKSYMMAFKQFAEHGTSVATP
ncbi:MAG: SRPBCC family protein [Algicola sp.]|nr:SRPBCC family protein [Algicola sp.]